MELCSMAAGFVGVLIALTVLLTIPIWLLWNWLMPTIFGVAEVTLLQALGLNLLASMLFKSGSRNATS